MGIFDWKHWIIILVVVVLVFGTKKLKGLGSDVGETIKGFRKAMNEEEDKPQAPPVQPAAPVQPMQQTHTPPAPQTAPVHEPHTIDVQAHKVEDPIRKD
ncbi:twin-arginine translocase TatA/TatE family subunit [Pseudomonas sp. NA-150]|uniref:twin-arginine translocase TatA/TatE family subunit n=1 Tax=Pseudomonas sp. NA-150 TaxID=3367525 RepID=UPI0037C81187